MRINDLTKEVRRKMFHNGVNTTLIIHRGTLGFESIEKVIPNVMCQLGEHVKETKMAKIKLIKQTRIK